MTAQELIQAGKLAEARLTLIEQIKAAPANLEVRNLLFQVLCFLGEWDKAARHLDILALQAPPGPAAAFLHYKNLVLAEKARLEVERGARVPEFLTEPPGYLGDFIQARAALAASDGERFSSLAGAIEGELPELRGVADGVPFEGFGDCNPGTFFVLEAFVHDRYLWFPFASLRELTVQKPAQLLDLLWVSATIVTWEGVTTDCYLPVLYAGTPDHEDDEVRLGRMTDWVPLAGGYQRGLGQHLLQLGEEEKGLLELRSVTFSYRAPENRP